MGHIRHVARPLRGMLSHPDGQALAALGSIQLTAGRSLPRGRAREVLAELGVGPAELGSMADVTGTSSDG
jgi:hypothetical protein